MYRRLYAGGGDLWCSAVGKDLLDRIQFGPHGRLVRLGTGKLRHFALAIGKALAHPLVAPAQVGKLLARCPAPALGGGDPRLGLGDVLAGLLDPLPCFA